MKYLSYDLETPNPRNDTVCAVGWVLMEEQNEISRGYSLIDPEAEFSPYSIRVHGITESKIKGAPTFAQYWGTTLLPIMGGACVIAHSAGFDMSVTAKALAKAGIEPPRIKYLDTVDVFSALCPGQSYKLSDLADFYGIDYQAHHAGEDAAALVQTLDALRKERGYADFSAMFTEAGVCFRSMRPVENVQQKRMGPYERHQARVKAMIDGAKEKNVDLTDIHFGFHGDLAEPQIERKGGLDVIIEALGGVFHKNVSGKLDYYVCFDDEMTGTVEKAIQLSRDPQYHLQIIDTDAFLDLLGYRTPAPNLNGPAAIRSRKRREREEFLQAFRAAEAEKAARAAAREKRRAEKNAATLSPAKQQGRGVIQMADDGTIIKEYDTVASAVSETGVNPKCIRDAASGKQKHAGGFCWKYKE